MNKLTAIVEYSDNNLSAYLEEVDGIVVTGKDIETIKRSMQEAIELTIATCKEMGCEVPRELCGEYEITYKHDLCSFLNAYSKILSKSGLETLTGINQKQLWHYSNGISKPRQATLDKVATAINNFGKELSTIKFA